MKKSMNKVDTIMNKKLDRTSRLYYTLTQNFKRLFSENKYKKTNESNNFIMNIEEEPAFLRKNNLDPIISNAYKNPHLITVNIIENSYNVEIRRILIEKYGWHRYIQNSKVKNIANDKYGTLYKKYYNNGDILSFVKVKNSTPELDGEFKKYYLQVPPHFMTAHEAVAWTFGLTADEYQPIVET
jgi:hypothetical protein